MVSGELTEFDRYLSLAQDFGKALVRVEPWIIAATINIEVRQ
jgi:hypothetical protein